MLKDRLMAFEIGKLMRLNWLISLRTPSNKNISSEFAQKKTLPKFTKKSHQYADDHSWLEAGDSSYFMHSSYVATNFNLLV